MFGFLGALIILLVEVHRSSGEMGPGAGFAIVIAPYVGFAFGTMLGFLASLTNGVLLGSLTLRHFEHSHRDARFYRRSGYACAVTSALLSLLLAILFSAPDLLWFFAPITICMWILGYAVTRWYAYRRQEQTVTAEP